MSALQHRAFLALGSNVGERAKHLAAARKKLGAHHDIRLEAASRVYETAPVGPVAQDAFLNQVIEITCRLSPVELLAECHDLEHAAGRVRRERWGPRTLDVDILLFDDLNIQSDVLEVPHPRMTERAFVLVPLAELAADRIVHGVTVREHLKTLDTSGIVAFEGTESADA